MTADEFRKIIVKATNEFCHGIPFRQGSPFRIQFPLEGHTGHPDPTNAILQLAIGLAEDLEGE